MASGRKKHKLFLIHPNARRIREAILHILGEAKKRGYGVTQYDIAKAIFLADRAHLNRYGRPITYDNYVAMEHGPVPSFTYDILKHDKRSIDQIGGIMWDRRAAPEKSKNAYVYSNPKRAADTDILARSDLEELSNALVIVKTLGFNQVRRLTHDDPAYLDAWEENSDRKSFDMSYALLFDSINDEMAEQIAFASKHID